MSDAIRAALQEAVDALAGGLWDYGPGQDEHARCNEVIARCRAVLAAAPVAAQEPIAKLVVAADASGVIQFTVARELKPGTYPLYLGAKK